MFKKNDLVECVNDAGAHDVFVRERYTIDNVDPIGNVFLDGAWYRAGRFKLVSDPDEFKEEAFSVLNWEEAKQYKGKRMMFAEDSDEVLDGNWFMDTLDDVEDNRVPFVGMETDYEFAKTCPETFEDVIKEKKKALNMSILQWEIMFYTGRLKREVYEFLGGVDPSDNDGGNCFLCDYGYNGCPKCIKWSDNYDGSGDPCCNINSPYSKWRYDKTKENTLKVLNHLKSELERLKNDRS
jgi:hypothetical protein